MAAREESDLFGKAGEMQSLLHGRVAAANHHDVPCALVKRAITRRAEVDAGADVIILTGDFQSPIRRAGGEQHSARVIVLAIRRVDFVIAGLHLHSFDIDRLQDFHAETPRLLSHARGEVLPANAFWKPWGKLSSPTVIPPGRQGRSARGGAYRRLRVTRI